MTKFDDVMKYKPIDLEEILYRARAVDLLRQSLNALGENGEYWCQGTARANGQRCLAQTFFEVQNNLTVKNEWNRMFDGNLLQDRVVQIAGIAIIECADRSEQFIAYREAAPQADIVGFNDSPTTNFSLVKKSIVKAIEKLTA